MGAEHVQVRRRVMSEVEFPVAVESTDEGEKKSESALDSVCVCVSECCC